MLTERNKKDFDEIFKKKPQKIGANNKGELI